jgi:hypothetical protein
MSYTDNGDGTVTDNSSGLMWQKCSIGQTDDAICSDSTWNYTWYWASGTYDATYNPASEDVCGALNRAGYSDWRLPSKRELMSIVDYSVLYPGHAINTEFFPNTSATKYWSSTTVAEDPFRAWVVDFDGGGTNGDDKKYSVNYFIKTDGYFVRCVRGGQYPAQSFTDNGNGTVTDNNTGLVWQQAEPGYKTWQAALDYCNGLGLGDRTVCRLPNIKELESLVDNTIYNPAIDVPFFPNAYASFYWSATTYAEYPFSAWGVDFYGGLVLDGDNKDYVGFVRCVCRPATILTGLAINGPSTVTENSSASYSATASWSDGSSSTVTPTWSEDSAFALISLDGSLTTTEVTADQPVTITASYTASDVTKSADKSITIVNVPTILTGLTINGPSTVNENSSASYSATASWSDGSSSTVTPTWSEDSAFASIGPEGLLTTTAVTGNQTVTITASYTAGSITKTATKPVTIYELSTTITVTSPNGGENWQAGTTQTITWTYTGDPGPFLKIKLLKNGIAVKTISSSTPIGVNGSGSFNWDIPADQAKGAKYRIKIISTTNKAYKDISDGDFTIIPTSIAVTSPNGGETWTRGSQQTIQWTYMGNPGAYVKIQLLKSGTVVRTISPGAPIGSGGSGSFIWNIAYALAKGSDYRVKIVSMSNSAYKDISDGTFRIQ